MCILLFTTAHPKYPLILLSNRDVSLPYPYPHLSYVWQVFGSFLVLRFYEQDVNLTPRSFSTEKPPQPLTGNPNTHISSVDAIWRGLNTVRLPLYLFSHIPTPMPPLPSPRSPMSWLPMSHLPPGLMVDTRILCS